ncbi:hypothetical protein DFH09DRAFT_351384 [Mycena vulgaris]|nr:hypothetical protein DFH09DRAFT_351384 [Mycena vulgaris]
MPLRRLGGIPDLYDLDEDGMREVIEDTYRDLHLDRQNQVRRDVALENTRLRHTNNVLLQKLAIYCRCDFATLPPEILLMVFRLALPPRWLCSVTESWLPYSQDLSSVDLRMKLSILSVCKSWHRVGTELLYESVTLRRNTQIPVFVRALEGQEGLGALVKRLVINNFVPRGYSILHESETKKMVELCPNLSHMGFCPAFWIPDLPRSLPAMSSSITSLAFSDTVPYSTIFPSLVQLCQSLKCLSLTAPAILDETHPVLTFDKLEELRLAHQAHSVVPASKWRFPNLRRFWLDVVWFFHRTHEAIQQMAGFVNAWLDAYGPPITFFRLSSTFNYSRDQLQRMLDRCPTLEYLAMDQNPRGLTHSRVKFIVVWVAKSSYLITTDVLKDGFPSLHGCRKLNLATRYLPIQIVLSEAGEEEEAQTKDVDVDVDVDDNFWPAVIRDSIDPGSVNGFTVDRTDLSEDYVFEGNEDDQCSSDGSDTDESDSGSDAITVSDDGDCLREDPFYTGEDWEVDHDEALEIFYRTREE